MLSLLDLVEWSILQLLRTRISIGERLSESRGRSLSSVNWFCKEAKYCACSPTALEESLVACSFKRTERHLCVMPIYVLPQPGQATSYTTLLRDKGGSLSVDGTDIYRKDTHTGQYSHFSSFEPSYSKTACHWVKSLYRRAFKICSTKSHLNNQIEIIKSFMSWNGYLKSIQNLLMKKLKTKYSDSSTFVTVNEDTVDNLPEIWIHIPYLGSRGDFLLKSCVNKVQRFLSKPVKFITIYDTKKLSYFVSNKDKLPPLSRSNVVYEVACPVCGKTYIGMTQRCLSVRLKEHATRLSSSAVSEHFAVCEHAQYLASLQNHFTLLNDLPLPSDKLSPIEVLVLNNYKILHSTKSNNYNILAILEALLIKHNKPFLNTGLKAMRTTTFHVTILTLFHL